APPALSTLSLHDALPILRTQRPVELKLWLAIDNRLCQLFDQGGHADRRTLSLAQNEDIHADRGRWLRRAPDNDLLHVVDELRVRSEEHTSELQSRSDLVC